MTSAATAVEWFRIDEGWDRSPITPDLAAELFAQLGTTGLASWAPITGVEVVIATLNGRAIGSGAAVPELAASVAERTGAEVQWGRFAGGPDSGSVAAARDRVTGAQTLTTAIYVLPTTLNALGVDRWLPTDPIHAIVPSAATHVVLEGRSVLLTDDPAAWNWAPYVRPVVAVTAHAHGSILEVFTPSGYHEGWKHRWRSVIADLDLRWLHVLPFGDPRLFGPELAALRAEPRSWHGLHGSSDATIDRVLAELGRSQEDAAALRALAREPWSEALPHRLIGILGLPASAGELLHEGAPPDAELMPIGQRWSWRSLRRGRGRALMT